MAFDIFSVGFHSVLHNMHAYFYPFHNSCLLWIAIHEEICILMLFFILVAKVMWRFFIIFFTTLILFAWINLAACSLALQFFFGSIRHVRLAQIWIRLT